jgi:EmrB/QacA subfamily drug resistance transporter
MSQDAQPAARHKWWPLLAVSIAAFMLLLDVTVVNVALPDIQRDLKASFDELQWVIDAYALTLAATMLIFGSLADRFGRRRLFTIGLAIFSVASLACGLAWDPLALNLFRGLQGLGGAAMLSTSLALIAAAYTGRERTIALSVWGATVAGAVATGPLIGGALVETLGWESVFFVNVPVGLLTAWLVAGAVPESRDPNTTGHVDIAGLMTLAGSMSTLLLALMQGNEQGWGSAEILGLFAAAGVLLVAFVAIERRAANPLLDLGLFRKPSTWGASTTILTLAISVFAMLTFLVLYIQNYLGYDAFETGLRLFPLTIASFFAAALVARVAERIPPRIVLAAGLTVAGAGLLLNRQVEVGSDWEVLLAGGILIGIGAGAVNPTVAATALGTAPVEKSGMASGLNNSFRLLGVAIGVAGLGAIMEERVDASLTDTIGGGSHEVVDLISTGNVDEVIRGAPDLAPAIETAFIAGMDTILLVAAAIVWVGAALALLLVRRRDFVAQG